MAGACYLIKHLQQWRAMMREEEKHRYLRMEEDMLTAVAEARAALDKDNEIEAKMTYVTATAQSQQALNLES